MIYFVAPDPYAFISGGNRFNKQIEQGLLELDQKVVFIRIDQIKSIISTSIDQIFIDTIYLYEIDLHELKLQVAKKVLIVHLLPSMLKDSEDGLKEHMILQHFDMVVANSAFCADYLHQIVRINKPIVIVQPFIEITLDRTEPPTQENVILVSNWLPNKQIDVFLNAVSQLDDMLPLKILMYGDRSMDLAYAQYCERLIYNSSLLNNSIFLYGATPHHALQRIMRESELLVDTSRFETYGMAVAEAIVSGLPVLSLGGGNIENLLGQGKSLSCGTMDDLVQNMYNFMKGKLTIVQRPIISIITNWSRFREQLKPLVN